MKTILKIVAALLIAGLFVCIICGVANAAPIAPEGIGNHEYREILLSATDEDIEVLEQVVYNEAGQCDDWELRLAVIETICNRVLSPEWPNTIKGVCTQKGQFSHKKRYIPEDYYEGVCDAIEMVVREGRTVLPSTDYVYFAIGKQSMATDHILLGDRSRKWQYMYFGRAKV